MSIASRIGAIVLLSLAARGWSQTTAPAITPPPGYEAIRQRLASDDFAVREAGQQDLEKIPPTQIETLRQLAAHETDAEVASRLMRRIEEMELYLIIHPPPLTVHLTNGSVQDLVTQLNTQLGASLVASIAPAAGRNLPAPPVEKITLAADAKPFWEIVNQAAQQQPMTFTAVVISATTDASPSLRVQTAAKSREYRLWESFAFTAQVSGQPETSQWVISITGLSDPRVRIAGYATYLDIHKLTDQDGQAIVPQAQAGTGVAAMARPSLIWQTRAILPPVKGLKSIKDFQATMTVSVVQKEGKISLDLTKPGEPVQCPFGTIVVDQAGGEVNVRVTNVVGNGLTASPRPYIRSFDADGKPVSMSILSTQHTYARASVSRAEITWVEKTHDVQIPVDWPGLEVPPPAAPNPPAVRPGPAIDPVGPRILPME